MKLKLHLFKKELFFFVSAHALGIYIVTKTLKSPPRPAGDAVSGLYVFLLFLIFLSFFYIFLKNKSLFYRLVLVLVIFFGAQTVFSVFLGSAFSSLAALMLLFAVLYSRNVTAHNIAVTLAIAGIGAVLGWSVSITTAIILLAAMAVYDIIAVYKTKHMVRMAKGMINAGAVFGLIIVSKKPKDFMILGSGDILLPLILVSAVAVYSIRASIIVGLFAAAGLFVTHLIFSSQKERKPMAALPPIATFSIIGYLLSLVI